MENSNHRELRELLQSIQRTIEMYNSINPQEKVSITKQEPKDVRNMFICVYNDKHVGLFRRINWSTSIKEDFGWGSPRYDAGSIYVGVDSNYIGMKETHDGYFSINQWQPAGVKIIVSDKSYVSNCIMHDEMSFDDMRLIMYNNGQIDRYEIGKATSSEMVDVLKYAITYYQLNNSMQNQRK